MPLAGKVVLMLAPPFNSRTIPAPVKGALAMALSLLLTTQIAPSLPEPTAGFLVVAAVTADPSKATGIDGAVKTVASWPAGQLFLLLAAVGLAAYGIYCFVMARYARM